MEINILTENQIRNIVEEEIDKKVDLINSHIDRMRARVIKLEEENKALSSGGKDWSKNKGVRCLFKLYSQNTNYINKLVLSYLNKYREGDKGLHINNKVLCLFYYVASFVINILSPSPLF